MEDKYFQVSTAALNIRSSPDSSTVLNKVSTLRQGDIIHAVEVVVNGGVTWHKLDSGRLYRDGAWTNIAAASPTGEYWTAERGSAIWMVETGNPQPPTSGEYILHVKDGVTRKFVPE